MLTHCQLYLGCPTKGNITKKQCQYLIIDYVLSFLWRRDCSSEIGNKTLYQKIIMFDTWIVTEIPISFKIDLFSNYWMNKTFIIIKRFPKQNFQMPQSGVSLTHNLLLLQCIIYRQRSVKTTSWNLQVKLPFVFI